MMIARHSSDAVTACVPCSKNVPELKQVWMESVEPVQSLIRNRFLRLSIKCELFAALDPILDKEIDVFKRHLRELFPALDLDKLVKAPTQKNASYNIWMENSVEPAITHSKLGNARMVHAVYQQSSC